MLAALSASSSGVPSAWVPFVRPAVGDCGAPVTAPARVLTQGPDGFSEGRACVSSLPGEGGGQILAEGLTQDVCSASSLSAVSLVFLQEAQRGVGFRASARVGIVTTRVPCGSLSACCRRLRRRCLLLRLLCLYPIAPSSRQTLLRSHSRSPASLVGAVFRRGLRPVCSLRVRAPRVRDWTCRPGLPVASPLSSWWAAGGQRRVLTRLPPSRRLEGGR